MSGSLRRSGIPPVGDIAWGTHFCHFFDTTADLCDTVVPYFIAGLEQRELCFWLLSDLTAAQCVDEMRRRGAFDVDRALADGSLLFQRTEEWYRREGVIDLASLRRAWDAMLLRSHERGYEGLRVAGYLSWPKEPEWADFNDFERDLEAGLAGRPMIVLCSYALAATNAAGILDVAHTHDFALTKREGQWEVLETPALRVKQLDIRNRQQAAVSALGFTAIRDYDLHALFAEAASRAAETLGTGRAIVWQLRPEQNELVLRAHTGWDELPPNATVQIVPGSPAHYGFTQDKPVVVIDVASDSRFVETSWVLREYKVATLLSALIRGHEQPWGALSVHSTTRRAFTDDDVEFLQSIANVLALAIERNEHELEERRKKEILQTIVDNIPVMIAHDDADGHILAANPEWERTLGWTAEEIRGTHMLEELFPDPARRRSAREFLQGAPGRVWRDFQPRTRDGRVIETTWARFGLSDGTSISVGIDVTERKRAEERFREIAENIDETFCVFTADLDFMTYLNPAGERLLGRTLDSFRGRRAWLEMVHPDDRESGLQNMSLRRSSQPYEDCRIVRPDGSIRWVSWRVSVLRGGGGDADSICVVMQDMTERRQAEQRLASLSRRLLSVQEEERRRLAIELHDELGQILTAAKIDLGTSPVRLDDAIGSIDHAMRTVRDLALDLRPAMLDDLGLAAALRWYADRFSRQTGVVTHLNVADVPGLDPGVATACFRVAQEALTNVTRHARAANVWIELRRAAAGVELTIRDDGTGFDVDAARERAARGASLGLTGMEERVSLAGGFIEIHSAPGCGTELRAGFPAGVAP